MTGSVQYAFTPAATIMNVLNISVVLWFGVINAWFCFIYTGKNDSISNKPKKQPLLQTNP